MPVAGCSGWDGFGCLFFGDCESGSGALLGAQDTSDGSWAGVCLSHAGFGGLFGGVRGLAGMGV
jgi:hypothetical protein